MKKLIAFITILFLQLQLISQVTVASTIKIPTQTGNAGKVLGTNGTQLLWTTSSGGSLSIGAIAPLFETAGTFSIRPANTSQSGALTSIDWNTFNNKQNALGFTPYNSTNPSNYISLTDLSATSPLNYNNSTGVFTIQPSSTSQSGVLSNTDWNTFNNKQNALNGTGFIKATGTTISYDNSTYLTAAGDVTTTATQTLTNKTIDSPTITGTSTFSNTTYNGVLNQFKGANAASSSTVDLNSFTGNYAHITGTTTINYLGVSQAGAERTLTFDGALTITSNTNIILPDNTNILTVANDVGVFKSEGSGVWRLINYFKNDNSYTVWSPSFTGYSANPTGVTARYSLNGKRCTVWLNMTSGTSNATTTTVTLPFNASSSAIQIFSGILIQNNGAVGTNPGRIDTQVGSNIADVWSNNLKAAWTSSGNKGFWFSFTYEIL